VLWILLGALYLTLFFLLGLATLRKGHYFLFFVGIIFPVLWIVGALLGPTQSAQADARRGMVASSPRSRRAITRYG
jgi:hypothetical protein